MKRAALLLVVAWAAAACNTADDPATPADVASTTAVAGALPVPTTTTAPPSTVPVVTVPPTTLPATTAPRPALTSFASVGDGIMYDAEPAIAAALAPATPHPHAYFGSGLSRPEQYDWETGWTQMIDQTDPQVVVVLLGPWDARDVTVDGKTLVLGSPDWETWFGGRVQRAVQILRSKGAIVVWMLPLAESSLAKRSRLTVLDAYLRRTLTDVILVDTDVAMSGASNTYADVAPDGTRMRSADGEHLCPTGAARIARAARAALSERFAVDDAPVPLGDWSTDGRYLDSSKGC